MASSMAVMTIERSIDFSRATASAICRSSSLLALTAIVSLLWLIGAPAPFRGRRVRVLSVGGFNLRGFLRSFAPPQRFRDQRIGEDQARLAHVVDRDQRFLASVLALEPRRLARDAQQDAAEALAAGQRNVEFDLHHVTGVALEIRAPYQRPGDSR